MEVNQNSMSSANDFRKQISDRYGDQGILPYYQGQIEVLTALMLAVSNRTANRFPAITVFELQDMVGGLIKQAENSKNNLNGALKSDSKE